MIFLWIIEKYFFQILSINTGSGWRVTGVDIDKGTGMGTGAAYCTHTVRVRVLVHEFFPKSSNIYLGNLSINTGTGLRVRVLHTSWWVNKYIFIYKVHISIMYTSWSSSDIITLNKINHTWSRGESQLHGTSASAKFLLLFKIPQDLNRSPKRSFKKSVNSDLQTRQGKWGCDSQ